MILQTAKNYSGKVNNLESKQWRHQQQKQLRSMYSFLYTVTTFSSAKFLVAVFQTLFIVRLCNFSLLWSGEFPMVPRLGYRLLRFVHIYFQVHFVERRLVSGLDLEQHNGPEIAGELENNFFFLIVRATLKSAGIIRRNFEKIEFLSYFLKILQTCLEIWV